MIKFKDKSVERIHEVKIVLKRLPADYLSYYSNWKKDNNTGIYGSKTNKSGKKVRIVKNGNNGSDNMFKCTLCSRNFKIEVSLKRHLLTHNGMNVTEAPCPICQILLPIQSLYSHYQKHHGPIKLNFQCSSSKCDKKFFLKHQLDQHSIIHRKDYICKYCGKGFVASSRLNLHLNIHTREEMSNCPLCDKQFVQSSHLERHLRTHTGERPFPCLICKKSFYRCDSLHRHEKTHKPDKKFACKKCKLRFRTPALLKTHSETHNVEREKHSCFYCKKTFLSKKSMQQHLRIHTGERPYMCKYCGRGFNQSSSLSGHILLHTKEKSHNCPLCDKSFATNGGLKSHLLTHAGQKLFQCENCEAKYSRKNSLTAHMRKHINTRN